MNYIQDALALIQLVPSILELIQQVEQIFGKGNGAAKKDTVMATVPPSAPPEVVNNLSSFVDRAVTAFHASGKFTKAAA